MSIYNPKEVEQKWQRIWAEKQTFSAPQNATKDNKYYVLPQLPYPSGSGLHVGHAEIYIACDIYARYRRMQGKKVLQVLGWDSFGLPAENYAIKTNIHPRESTNAALDNFRFQIKTLGISVDWDREVASHNPDYYKFTQWFFLLMYERGLAYRKKQNVNWCESCKTVLANEQVESDGTCERCGTAVLQKEMEQWYLRITEYADKLLEGLDRIDWPEETKKRQKDWIGKSEGALVKFKIKSQKSKEITVFTTRPDTIFGATYLVLAPEDKLIGDLRSEIGNWGEVEKYIEETKHKTELERKSEKEKTGVELKGVVAINPATNEEIPVWIADYVLTTYGTGAIMAVPAHDERDFEFAQKFNLPIRKVVVPPPTYSQYRNADDIAAGAPSIIRIESDCYLGEGENINSGYLNGLKTKEAKEKIIAWLEDKGIGQRKIQYKLRDWSVSRQRFWGAPIPMLRHEKTGELKPVDFSDLPVRLPDDVDFRPTGQSPLTYSEEFQKGVEEKYGKGWRREVDTLDTFMCSSWYYYRYLDPKNDKEFASSEALKTWMPVDFYLGGVEHVNGHLLYARFFTKVLFDAGYIDFDEPFTVHRHQGLILGEDGRKMSKRWGNVINPTTVVDEYGADTLRMYEMFMGPLEEAKPWDTNGVKGVKRFLEKVWRLQEKVTTSRNGNEKYEIGNKEIEKLLHKTIKKVGEDIENLSFNTSVAKMMELVNEVTKAEYISSDNFSLFVKILSPFAPHIAEELWNELGNKTLISEEKWPVYDESKLVEDTVMVAVQINGKVRGTLGVAPDAGQKEVLKLAEAHEQISKWIAGKELKKVIYVSGKILNIVV